jgi:dTDP-4-dehydrorhamnose reductase
MSRLLILGGSGILGSELTLLAERKGLDYSAPTSTDLDVRDQGTLNSFVSSYKPHWIINCAAWTNVDGAEDFPGEALELNATAVKNIIERALKINCRVIHISTDYVFDGEKKEPYEVSDAPNPINRYGSSKLQGEYYMQDSGLPGHYVIRTSWLYGARGKNFVKTIAKKAIIGDSAAVVADQFGSPTSARDLASGIFQIIETAPESGVYHYSNTGKCSWFDLAQVIYRLTGRDLDLVTPITSEVLTQKAKRPMNSHLSTSKWESSNLSKIRPWKVSLEELLPEILAAVNEEALS